MSNGFPPTPAELIGIVLVLLFWVIDLILSILNGEGVRILLDLAGGGITGWLTWRLVRRFLTAGS